MGGWDDGKEHGNYHITMGLYRGYIGVILYWLCESCESPHLGGTVVKVEELIKFRAVFFFAIEVLSVAGSSRHLAPVVGRGLG